MSSVSTNRNAGNLSNVSNLFNVSNGNKISKGKKNGIFYLSASPHHILNILFVTSIFCNLSER